MSNYTLYFTEADSGEATLHNLSIEKMQLLMRESVYWTNMNADIEHTVKQCATCLEYQQTQAKERTLHYKIPYKPWEVVSADIFTANFKSLLCIVDFYSKFPIVKKADSLSR